MNRILGVLGIVAIAALALVFAAMNSGQRVTLRLGFATLYGVPLTVVAFGSIIAGMVVMLVAGVRSDLKVRQILRSRLVEEDREERARFVDGDQQDLFEAEGSLDAAPGPPPAASLLATRPDAALPPALADSERSPTDSSPPPLPGSPAPTEAIDRAGGASGDPALGGGSRDEASPSVGESNRWDDTSRSSERERD